MKIINVMASSVDGFIGAKPNESDVERQKVNISSKADHEHLLTMMESADAVVVGASSIRANCECLELLNKKNPDWYIFAQTELNKDMNFWDQKLIRRSIISSNQLPIHNTEVNFIHLPNKGTHQLVEGLLEVLKKKAYANVLLFGGGEVNSWFYEMGLVDELCLTIAPVIIASEEGSHFVSPKLPHPVSLRLKSFSEKSDFLFLNYKVSKI